MVAAMAASVSALAALALAFASFRELRQDRRTAQVNLALQSLWRLADEWGSDDMLDARSEAAASLLADQPSRDVDDVLNFFDEVAVLLDRGMLDEELVWYEFYWPMANYWFASQDHVRQAQKTNPAAWLQLSRLVPRLVEVEKRRHSGTADEAVPTKTQMREFLQAEADSSDRDEDEADVRRTPL
jgi:hypothetical protein